MRYSKYFLLLISFLSFGINVKAQHVGTINDFEVLSEYLTSTGKIKISNTSETTIKFKVSFVRELANSGSVGSFKPFNMSIQLSTNDGNNIVLLGTANKITGTNFAANQAMLLDKEFTTTIDNAKLKTGGHIILAYMTDDKSFPINSFNSKLYQIELPTTTGPIITPSIVLMPVYRMRSENGGHYLTLKPSGPIPERGYEIAFYVKSSGSGVNWYHELIHRNDNGNPDEYTYAVGSYNSKETPYWTFGGSAFPTNTFYEPDLAPVYEFKNKNNNNRYYTTDISATPSPDYELQGGERFYVHPVVKDPRPPRGEDPRPPRGGETTPPRGEVGGVRPGSGG